MFSSLLTKTVVIQSGVENTDRYNNVILDWSAPDEVCARAWVAQLKKKTFGAEDLNQRDAVTTSLVAFFEPGTPIDAYKRVVVDGDVYQVDGAPDLASTPRGVHHLEVHLDRVAG